MNNTEANLVTLNNVIIDSMTADAFTSFQSFIYTKKQQMVNLKPNGGYMSRYRLIEELCNLVILTPEIPTLISQLILRAKTTEGFNNIASDTASLDQLESFLNSLNATNFKVSPNAFIERKTTNKHPYFGVNTSLYGMPNKTTLDPRRSGKVVILDIKSDDIFLFMVEHGPDFGFVWYGLDKGYWLYDSEMIKNAQKVKTKIKDTMSKGINLLTDLYN